MIKIDKNNLISHSNFVGENYTLKFDKENRFAFLIPGNTNFLSIYDTNGNIVLMINVDRDKKIGVGIEKANNILKEFDFELDF